MAHLVQRSVEWFEYRKRFDITGSELASAIGIDNNKCRNRLLQEKYSIALGIDTKPDYNPIMQYGIDNETRALDMFTAVTGLKVIPTGIHHIPDIAGVKIGSSPDGINLGRDFALEIKCKWSGRLPDSVQTNHILQGMAHMEATNTSYCLFWYWTDREYNNNESGRLFVLHRNSALFSEIVASQVKEFVKKYKTAVETQIITPFPSLRRGYKGNLERYLLDNVKIGGTPCDGHGRHLFSTI